MRFLPVLIICGLFTLLGFALVGQQFYGSYTPRERTVELLAASEFEASQEADGGEEAAASASTAEPAAECLVLWNSREANSQLAQEDIQGLFAQMKVDADFVDISTDAVPDCSAYENLVFALVDSSKLGDRAYEILDWVGTGGGLMVYFPPQGDYFFRALGTQMGIIESGWEMYEVPGFRFQTDLMLGGQGHDFMIEDPYESAHTLSISEDCLVHMVSADERELPLMWERDYGEGRIVFMNFGIMGKAYRGIYGAAYSLLDDAAAWPVINGSAFYLDDFPSPVPSGTSTYIERDYGLSVSDFYTNVWWPDLRELAETYGIYYSGMVIEDYNEELEPPYAANSNTQRFLYFGNSLLRDGGEIGLHGYNHIPLCMEGFDADFGPDYRKGTYERLYDYDYWASREDMRDSVSELIRFTEDLYPGNKPQVYVPPSNILSAEAREMLAEEFPQIRAVASIYFEGDVEYTQEFEVAEDGIVETPRVISGCIIDDFMEIAALSELNLHFVNSHFMHPDDVLDEDRGAEAGWEAMRNRLSEYMDWLYTAAPEIRNLSATELAGAVQRYYYLDVQKEITEDEIILNLSNFRDEAYLFLRINGREPDDPVESIRGGELTSLGGGLYLVKAEQGQVVIERGEG